MTVLRILIPDFDLLDEPKVILHQNL